MERQRAALTCARPLPAKLSPPSRSISSSLPRLPEVLAAIARGGRPSDKTRALQAEPTLSSGLHGDPGCPKHGRRPWQRGSAGRVANTSAQPRSWVKCTAILQWKLPSSCKWRSAGYAPKSRREVAESPDSDSQKGPRRPQSCFPRSLTWPSGREAGQVALIQVLPRTVRSPALLGSVAFQSPRCRHVTCPPRTASWAV